MISDADWHARGPAYVKWEMEGLVSRLEQLEGGLGNVRETTENIRASLHALNEVLADMFEEEDRALADRDSVDML